MAYQYTPYDGSRWAGTLGDLIASQGRIRANQARTVADAQSRAVQIGGQASAQMANAIGGAVQQVAQIPQQLQQQKRAALQDEVANIELRSKRRQESDITAMDSAFQKPDRDGIINALPGHLRPGVMKQFQEADAAALKVKESRQKIQEANNEYLAGLGHAVATHGYDLSATGLALQHARDTFESAGDGEMVKQIDAIAQQIQADPNALKPIVDRVIGLSPKFTELRQTQQHQNATESQANTDAEERSRHNVELERIAALTAGRQEATQKETERHNKAMEALRSAQLTQGEAAPALSPEALKLTAHQYAMTGQLPPMGMGKQGAATRAAIINEAAKAYAGLDLPTQQAAYQANKTSLGKLQQQRDAIGAFEATAVKNLKVFTDLAEKIPDTGSPYFNAPLRSLLENKLGGDTLTAYNTARRTVIPEFAKILANPGLSGQLSDSARREIEEVVSGSATLKQTMAAAKVLLQDVENRKTSYDDQIKAIQQRIATPPGQIPKEPAAAGAMNARAREVLQRAGKVTDDAAVALFLKNNPGFK